MLLPPPAPIDEEEDLCRRRYPLPCRRRPVENDTIELLPFIVSEQAGGLGGGLFTKSGLTCFIASSYVGGGLSHLVESVVPKNEKNLDGERNEPEGLVTPRCNSAREDLTDH